MKNKIIAVAGHTASGKTGLAIRLAEALGGEIVCCDSMQIYRVMDIGTAKPTLEELARVPHHMVDFVDPMREYSCAEYAEDAERAIKDIISRGKLPVICGGTGLYLDTLLFERPFDEC
jgi:tRNA dimethylallyltransferase